MSVREQPVMKRMGVLRPENMTARAMLARVRMPRGSAIRVTSCVFLEMYHALRGGVR